MNTNEQAQALLNQEKSNKTVKVPVTTMITQEQRDVLEALALENGTNISNLLRVALRVTYNIK